MNIIIKDGKSSEQKHREDFAKQIIKGYYEQECAQKPNMQRKSARETNAIKRAWETFPDSGL